MARFWTSALATLLPLALLLGEAAPLHAQNPTTIQLPTFSFFAVRTTVSVPDQGNAYLAGLSRYGTVRPEFRSPLQHQRGLGVEGQFTGVSVSAQIHDFRFYEAQLESGVSASQQPASQEKPRLAAEAPTAADPARLSVAEIERRRQATQSNQRDEEVDRLLGKAQQAEQDGKPGVAKIYYQMAGRRATGETKQAILESLQRLTDGPQRVAGGQK